MAEAHLDGSVCLEDIARLSGLSPFHLHLMLRQSRGVPLHGWVTERRIRRAKALLAGRMPLAGDALWLRLR